MHPHTEYAAITKLRNEDSNLALEFEVISSFHGIVDKKLVTMQCTEYFSDCWVHYDQLRDSEKTELETMLEQLSEEDIVTLFIDSFNGFAEEGECGDLLIWHVLRTTHPIDPAGFYSMHHNGPLENIQYWGVPEEAIEDPYSTPEGISRLLAILESKSPDTYYLLKIKVIAFVLDNDGLNITCPPDSFREIYQYTFEYIVGYLKDLAESREKYSRGFLTSPPGRVSEWYGIKGLIESMRAEKMRRLDMGKEHNERIAEFHDGSLTQNYLLESKDKVEQIIDCLNTIEEKFPSYDMSVINEAVAKLQLRVMIDNESHVDSIPTKRTGKKRITWLKSILTSLENFLTEDADQMYSSKLHQELLAVIPKYFMQQRWEISRVNLSLQEMDPQSHKPLSLKRMCLSTIYNSDQIKDNISSTDMEFLSEITWSCLS